MAASGFEVKASVTADVVLSVDDEAAARKIAQVASRYFAQHFSVSYCAAHGDWTVQVEVHATDANHVVGFCRGVWETIVYDKATGG